MGTGVGISSPEFIAPDRLQPALDRLHEADRVFSLWKPDSPMSRLRSDRSVEDVDAGDLELIDEVLEQCRLARELTGGAFDPWAMPGGVDPTGLVKGWAARRALDELLAGGVTAVMVNAGGDIATFGKPAGRNWRVGIRHPAQPNSYCALVEVDGAIATSGDYERPGQLIDPQTRRVCRLAASATVTGPDLGLADALATGLAVGGAGVLAAIDGLDGYQAYLITDAGRRYASSGMAFVSGSVTGADGTEVAPVAP